MSAKRITDLLAGTALIGSELLEISQLSATVKITAVTISAAAADNSYNDSGNGFLAAGFAVGDRVKVAGFTGNVANNILVGIVTIAAAGKLTIGGTDGDVIVDDAAGESVTITKWVTRRTSSQDLIDLAVNSQTEVVPILVSDPGGAALTVGDGKAYFRVPSTLNGYNLTGVAAAVTTVSSSGNPTIQIANATDAVDMLSTKITIDSGEKDSSTAAAAAVIDAAHDDVATADQLRIDVDVAGTGTKGLMVELQFRKP